MGNQDPQSATPEGMPGETPQQTPAANVGLDSMRLPPNPLHQPQQGSSETDWEARFKGLNQRYQDDRQKWDQERQVFSQRFDALEQQIKSLAPQAKAPAQKPQAKAPEPVSAGNPEGANQDSELYDLLAQRDAERYKWKLIAEYSKPGKPGYGLDLFALADNIQTYAPDLSEDGAVDDSAQREEIEKIIGAFQNVRGSVAKQTQEAMTSGWTPGIAPGAPPPPDSQEALLQRYYQVKEAYGNGDDSLEGEYYKLHDQLKGILPSQTVPWPTNDEIARQLQQMQGTMGKFETMLNAIRGK